MAQSKSSTYKLWLALLSVYFFWGTSFFAIKTALMQISPLTLMGGRSLFAGLILLLSTLLFYSKTPKKFEIMGAVLSGMILVGSNALIGFAQLNLSSSLAGALASTVPIWTCFFLFILGKELNYLNIISTGIGFAGVVLLSSTINFQSEIISFLLVLLSSAGWALGTILTKYLIKNNSITSASIQLCAGGGFVLLLGFAKNEPFPITWSSTPIFATIYLSVFCSAIGILAYNYVNQNGSPLLASSYAYVCPLVALATGSFFANERIGLWQLLGAILICISVAAESTNTLKFKVFLKKYDQILRRSTD